MQKTQWSSTSVHPGHDVLHRVGAGGIGDEGIVFERAIGERDTFCKRVDNRHDRAFIWTKGFATRAEVAYDIVDKRGQFVVVTAAAERDEFVFVCINCLFVNLKNVIVLGDADFSAIV